ncbi:MAG: chemotaxis response regulator protein-glutamate methylesterase [Desulfatibacillaceae bacterium]
MAKTKVLIIDDSAVVRQTMTAILETDPKIQVVGAAADPYFAAEKLRTLIPDVITLDIEMPRMDGLTFLRKLMDQHPMPVVICSSVAEANSENALRALDYGAVEIISKPRIGTKQYLEESRTLICDAVKAAAKARVRKPTTPAPAVKRPEPKYTADAVMAGTWRPMPLRTTEKVVVVGASTGGTEALRAFLEAMPMDAPGIIIVQHMPEHFTRQFARRLDTDCRINVKEAENFDSVLRGRALIAPGNRHILLKRSGAQYRVEVKDGPLVCRHRPSVDVLFRSTARYAGKNSVGVLLTGMGDDGARGLLEMKQAGADTVAQDEATCIVFGMPGEAIKLGAASRVLPLDRIAQEVIKLCQ